MPDARTPQSLWRHRDFKFFWSGQTVSMVGSAVSFVALPLVAVLALHATALEMGVLTAAERLPPLLIGPFVGPLVDRAARRRLMLVADLGRAALLAWIPVGAVLHSLAIWHMVVIAFGVGALTLLFNVAYQSFLPNVVDASQLADSNAKLSASQSVAEVSGPGIAAWLIALGGASVAVVADAASYVLSFLSVLAMRSRDTDRSPDSDRFRDPDRSRDADRASRSIRQAVAAFRANTTSGFIALWRDPVLRSVTVSNAVLAFFSQMQAAIYFLFLVQTLHLSAAMIGLLFTISAAGGFLAALACDRVVNRFGLGRLIVAGQVVLVAGGVFLAAASGPKPLASVFIVAGESCFSAGMVLFGVGYTTMFQLRSTDEIRGRIIGAAKFMSASAIPVAAIAGGLLAGATSPRTALAVGAAGMVTGLAAVLRRRVLMLRTEGISPQLTIEPSLSSREDTQAADAAVHSRLDSVAGSSGEIQ